MGCVCALLEGSFIYDRGCALIAHLSFVALGNFPCLKRCAGLGREGVLTHPQDVLAIVIVEHKC